MPSDMARVATATLIPGVNRSRAPNGEMCRARNSCHRYIEQITISAEAAIPQLPFRSSSENSALRAVFTA